MPDRYVLQRPFTLTCPECGGALFPRQQTPASVYVCHVGHELNGAAMLEAQAGRIEATMCNALALLNERRELCRQLIEAGQDDNSMLGRLEADAERRAELLRGLLSEGWVH